MNNQRSALNSPQAIYLGVDGGGTKTVAHLGVVVDGCLQTLGTGQSGPSNPRAVGFQVAQKNVQSATVAAFCQADIPIQTVDVACLCLAGAGRQEERQAIHDWAISQQLARQVQLVSEAQAVLAMLGQPTTDQAGTSSETADIALICGTGSLAWGQVPGTNRQSRSGGWGYMLGDEGSAFWLGQQLAMHVCRVSDGRRHSDDGSVDKLLKHLSLGDPSGLIAWCYADGDSRQKLASLSPLLFEDSQPHWVNSILREGARQLASMIVAVIHSLSVSRYRLALAGGVITGQSAYLQLLLDSLPITPVQWQSITDPAAGALRLASDRKSR